jgi:hypothetical protein
MRFKIMAAAPAVLSVIALALHAPQARAEQGWGTVKGQVVFEGPKLPEVREAKVDKDQKHCLEKGKILQEDWVINPKNHGVRYALVWLAPEPGGDPLPVNPRLKPVPKKPVTIDQPCCMFVPRVLALREGQELRIKNSAPISHSIRWTPHPAVGVGGNVTVPSKGIYTITGLKAQKLPVKLDCGFHSWMGGWVGVFKHPYFAVTDANGKFVIKDAPAGTYRLIVWQEAIGYRGGAAGRNGQKITILADKDTNVGKLGLKLPDEDK